MALAKLGQINLLYPLYGVVLIPSAVYEETVLSGLARGEPDATSVEMLLRGHHLQVINIAQSELSSRISALPLDRGEKYAIQLATNTNADWILLDDMLARQEASSLGLKVKGTLGIFVDAVRQDFLNISEIDVIFEALLKRDDIWIADGLVRHVWNDLKTKFGHGSI